MAEWITKSYEKERKDENGNVLKDENGKIITDTIENKYRVDVDFVPKKSVEICTEFMIAYCKSKGKEDAQWLLSLIKGKKEVIDEKGNKTERKNTTLEVKKEFVAKYFPNIIKKKEAPKTDSYIKELEDFLNS